MRLWAPLAALMLAAICCSSSDDSEPVEDTSETADAEAPENDADDDALPPTDTGDTVSTDAGKEGDDGQDKPPPPKEPQWVAVPTGSSGDLHRVRFLGEPGFIAVGDNGTLLRPLAGGWVRAWTPIKNAALRDVAIQNQTLHAVGDNGTWLTKDTAGAWRPWNADVDAHLNGLVAHADGVIAVGSGGVVILRNGDDWGYEQINAEYDLQAVATAGTGETFAVGSGGLVLRRTVDGDTVDWFKTSVADVDVTLHSVFVLDALNVWAVGDKGTVVHYSGPWTPEPTSDEKNSDLFAVAGGGGRMLAVGGQGTFLQRNQDGQWPLVNDLKGPLLATRSYEGIAVGGSRIVAVGANGAMQVKQLPDQPFVDASSQPTSAIRDIAVEGDTAAMVGDDGLVIWWDLNGYGALESGTEAHLWAAHMRDNVLWAAGDNGTVLRRAAGGAFQDVQPPTNAHLYGATSLLDGTIVVVGQAGTCLRIQASGKDVAAESTGQVLDLLDVFMDGNLLTAVGRQGTLLQRKNGKWESMGVTTTADLQAGDHKNGLSVVVGTQGTVIHWTEGAKPTINTLDPAAVYYGVSVASGGTATLAGWAGTLHELQSDGTLNALAAPAAVPMYAVARYHDELLLGGSSGSLWQFTTGDDKE